MMEPLPYDTIDTNIEHEVGERPPLRNTLIGSKGLTIIAPSMTYHFCIIPELFLQMKQIWPHPVASQDFETPPPIKGIVRFPEIQIYPVQGLFIHPSKLLV